MSVVYFSLLLFVRIEQNVKIYNYMSLHLDFRILHRIYDTYKIVRKKLFSFYPENTSCFLWCYCKWCYHKDCVTPQTFCIKIVNKHIIP